MRLGLIIGALMICCPAYAQTNPISYTAALAVGNSCGGATLNTNLNTCSGSAPTLGAAGTTTTDPDFGNKVLRVTDTSSYCSIGTPDRSYITQQGGSFRGFNSASPPSAILVGDVDGDFYVQPLSLGSMTTAAGCQIIIGGGSTIFGGTTPVFAATNPNLIYGIDTDGVHFDSYNWVTKAKTQLINTSTAIPGFTPIHTYLNYGDALDHWFCFSSNTQDSGTLVGCWNQNTGNTAVANLGAATTQSNSASAVAMDNLTSTNLAGCAVHEIQSVLSGIYWVITVDGCSTPPVSPNFEAFHWQVGTNHVFYNEDPNAGGGEGYFGYDLTFKEIGGCSPFVDAATAMFKEDAFGGNPSNWAGVTPCSPQYLFNYCNAHASYLNDYNDSYVDQYPFLFFQITQSSTTSTTGCPKLSGDTNEFEIIMVQDSVAYATLMVPTYRTYPSTVAEWRIAHTYNDAIDDQCPWIGYTAAQISQDGKYAAFSSDWQGGTGTGIDGCSGSPSRRTDVFIAALPQVSTTPTSAPAAPLFAKVEVQ